MTSNRALTHVVEHQVILTVGGPQAVAVTTHNRQPGDGRPAILVSYASVLTIAHDPVAVGRRTRAWHRARELAQQGHLPPAPRYFTGQQPLYASAALIARPDAEPVQVSAHGSGNALHGSPDVIVRVGALSVRCLDADAVHSIAEAWDDADRLRPRHLGRRSDRHPGAALSTPPRPAQHRAAAIHRPRRTTPATPQSRNRGYTRPTDRQGRPK